MSEIKKSELAEFMRECIEASGLSYEEIANRCGYRSDRPIRMLATGRIPVPIDQASNIAEAIGCDPDRFIILVLKSFLPDDIIMAMGRAIEKFPQRKAVLGPIRSRPSFDMMKIFPAMRNALINEIAIYLNIFLSKKLFIR